MMFGVIKQMFSGLLSFSGSLASIDNTPGHTQCIPSNNQ